LSGAVAKAEWPTSATIGAVVVLAAGFIVLLRRHLKLLVGLVLLALLIWKGVPFIFNGPR
jgi:hypothetical protein